MSNPYAAASRPRLGKFKLRTGDGPLKTRGHLRVKDIAFVYVGIGKRGRIKVGMTGNPTKRCSDLKVALHYAHPVLPEVAKEIETRALALLGQRVGDGEWTALRTAEEAAAAVREAFLAVARFRRACPYMTDEEARLWRISVASGNLVS